MAELWLRACTVFLALSFFLQLVGFVSPGWAVNTDSYSGIKTSTGLLYYVTCVPSVGCTSGGILELLAGPPMRKYQSVYLIVIALIQTILPLILSTAVLVFKVLCIKKNIWLDSSATITMVTIGLANTLQWLVISQFANLNAQAEADFPWSLLIYAFGSLFAFAVLATNFIVFVKKALCSNQQVEINMS